MPGSTEAAKEKRRQYLNEWRKRNKDKVSRYNREYWERKAEREQGKAGDPHSERTAGSASADL